MTDSYYLGIDGGGTKTVFTLCDCLGNVKATCRCGSADYRQIGLDGMKRLLEEGMGNVCAAGMAHTENLWACMGVPNYGEDAYMDTQVESLLWSVFPHERICLVNDSEAGWAGSLALEPGINLVSGTGSISFGRNKEGRTASVGGWSDFFSDEGSCHWLGLKCLEIFSKEADGRKPKGALHRIIREAFGLQDDKEIIRIVETNYRNSRANTASLQWHLCEAALAGDPEAEDAYLQAAEELFLIIQATASALHMTGGTKIACSGGLFHEGSPVIPILKKKIAQTGMCWITSRYSPDIGAVLLAAEHAGAADGLLRQMRSGGGQNTEMEIG